MRRLFGKRQRRILAWQAAGRCVRCGQVLDEHFHADHVIAYSKGGKTVTRNGQALCPTCNMSKGSR